MQSFSWRQRLHLFPPLEYEAARFRIDQTDNRNRQPKHHHQQTAPHACNCNNSNECPLQKKCLLDCIVYKAEVVTNNSEPKDYIGMTGNTFKKRLYNHNKSFKNVIYRNNTELSKYVWNLKEKRQNFTINWSILKRAASYSSGGKRCNLCLQEKLCILKADKSNLLNRRRELFSKCVHQKRFLAGNFERAQAQSRTQTQSRKQYNGYQRHQAGKVS